mmetsp:Transcript_2736/g.7732  ORF Transcript_2736/g.7732 Transcript_2736/m.7732 type:complete len:262 (-) Transcript_2736:624-1409(-)
MLASLTTASLTFPPVVSPEPSPCASSAASARPRLCSPPTPCCRDHSAMDPTSNDRPLQKGVAAAISLVLSTMSWRMSTPTVVTSRLSTEPPPPMDRKAWVANVRYPFPAPMSTTRSVSAFASLESWTACPSTSQNLFTCFSLLAIPGRGLPSSPVTPRAYKKGASVGMCLLLVRSWSRLGGEVTEASLCFREAGLPACLGISSFQLPVVVKRSAEWKPSAIRSSMTGPLALRGWFFVTSLNLNRDRTCRVWPPLIETIWRT